MAESTCFIVMPIGSAGTPEHTHYLSLYNDYLKPAIESKSFKVVRADEIARSGAITKDIVEYVAKSDLVIADLSGLNPNVFYELGVRHALRKYGTLMTIDESRSPRIPFDISAYRVIKYNADLRGVAMLRDRVFSFIDDFLKGSSVDHADNPVHDWLPVLPPNVIDATSGTEFAEVRSELAEARKTLREYESRYGRIVETTTDAIEKVREILEDARAGNLPSDLVAKASGCAASRDKVGFLEVVERLLRKSPSILSFREYVKLVYDAQALGLPEVASPIFEHGMSAEPESSELFEPYMSHLAHSDEPRDREMARVQLSARLGLDADTAGVSEKFKTASQLELALAGVMLDAYLADGMYEEALRLTRQMVASRPQSSIALRNHARSLDKHGDSNEALLWFRKAVTTADADDTSAVWLGNTFHNTGNHVEALEAYALACCRDPNDAENFAHMADEVSFCILNKNGVIDSNPDIEDLITIEMIEQCTAASLSCRGVSEQDLMRLKEAAERVSKSFDMLVQSSLASNEAVSLHDRQQLAQGMYDRLKSDVTDRDVIWGEAVPGVGGGGKNN